MTDLIDFNKQSGGLIDFNQQRPNTGTLQNIGYGALRGAADIGQTLLSPFPGAEDRKQGLESFFQEKADPESLAFKGGRIASNIAGTAPLAEMRVLEGAGIGTQLANQALAGATQGALTSGGENIGQAALAGGVAGAAVPAIGKAVGRVLSPQTSEAVKRLQVEGVTPTIGQALGGTAKTIEDKLTSVPIIGDAINSARSAGLEQFNRAAMNRALAPIGETLPKDVPVGREAYRYTEGKLGDAYDTIKDRIKFAPDQQFVSDLQNIEGMARLMPTERAAQFQRILDAKLYNKMAETGRMNGESFKTAESELLREARTYSSSPDADQRKLGQALNEVVNSMRQGLQRSNPEVAGQLSSINEGWANLTRLRDASSMLGAEEGVFTPAQLQNAVKRGAGGGPAGKGQFARSEALMQDLSEAGKSVLPSKYPDSGTAGRLALGGAMELGAMGALGPKALAPILGAVPYLPGVRNLMADALTRRPELVRKAGAGVSAISPYLSPAAIPASNQLLARLLQGS